MVSPTAKTQETLAMIPCKKFEGHTDVVWGIIHLPGGQWIMTCSRDGSLRVWNLKSGKQVGEDWRDGESKVRCIALSPDGKTVVSGSEDGAVRLWDIDTCKVITKWMGHTKEVVSVCWSRDDGQRVLSGSLDKTARQCDMESGETRTILEPGHTYVFAVVYSPDMSMIATGGLDEPWSTEPIECSIKIWDTQKGELVATLKGHTSAVTCLAWTKDAKIISGSADNSIRTWNTKTWKQIAVLEGHTCWVWAIAISPNGRILASASDDKTAQLWNLDNGRPIRSLQHEDYVNCVTFSADGKLLATGCRDTNAYTWDVAAVLREDGLADLLEDPIHDRATHPVVQRSRVPQGFFDGAPSDRSHSSARSRPHYSAPPGSTFIGRFFHRNRKPSSVDDTSPSFALDWARNILKRRGRIPAVRVPYAKGKRRNACARERREPKIPTASSSRPSKPNVIRLSLQPQAADSSSSTASTIGDATGIPTTSTPSRPDAVIRQAGLWTRFWLMIGCISPEYTDGHH